MSDKRTNLLLFLPQGFEDLEAATILDVFGWNQLISCDGPGASLEVAFLLMECVIGSEMTQEVRGYMMYDS
ncbi:MAG TPA: hypothetical protein VMW90_07650 [Acidobacteriota bacterium]|nr:hypothetical protein [Acidobacteriota bacterium]